MIIWTWNGPNLSELLVLAVLSIGAVTAYVPSSSQASSDKSRSDKGQEDAKMEVTHLRLYGKDKK